MPQILNRHGQQNLHTKPIAGHMSKASHGNRDIKANPIPKNEKLAYPESSRYANYTGITGMAKSELHTPAVQKDQTEKMDNFMNTGIETKYIIIGGVLIAGFIYFYTR